MFDALLTRRGLSLDRLAALVSLAEAGTLARAASQNPVRQSLLSRQIRELEQFFEVALVSRVGRGLVLTPAGESLAKLVRETFRGLEDFRDAVRGEPLTIRIGAGDSVIHWNLMPKLADMLQVQEGVEFSFHNLRSGEIADGLQNLSLDVGVVRATALSKPLESRRLVPVELRLFIPRSLAREQTGGSWRQIVSRFPLAMQGAALGNAPVSTLARRDRPESASLVWCDSYPQVARAVATGECVGILPASAVTELVPERFWSINVGRRKYGQSHLTIAWNPRLVELRPVVGKIVDLLELLMSGKSAFRTARQH